MQKLVHMLAVAMIVVVAGWPALTPQPVGAAPADRTPVEELVPDEGGHLLGVILRNEQRGVDGIPTAEVVLRNKTFLWYIVTTGKAAAGDGALKPWVLLPPCRVQHATQISCDGAEAVLGRLPLRPGTELELFVDATGSEDAGDELLGLIWAFELFWRVAFAEPLPLDIGTALESIAYSTVGNVTMLANPPLGVLFKIWDAVRQGGIEAIPKLVEVIGEAIDNPEVRAYLLNLGYGSDLLERASAASAAVRAVRLGVALGELPLTFILEGLAGGNALRGRVHAQVPPLILPEGLFVKGSGPAIYQIEAGMRRLVPDWSTFLARGGDPTLRNVRVLEDYELATVPEGAPIPGRDVPERALLEQIFRFQGVSFSSGPFPASEVHAVVGTQGPPFVEFRFGSPYAETQAEAVPSLLVFPMSDQLSSTTKTEAQTLTMLLGERPGTAALSARRALPFLLPIHASQVLHAKAAYVFFHRGAGIRYVTMHAQQRAQVTNQALLYTFQGLSSDGRFGIVAMFPVKASSLPEVPLDDAWEAIMADWDGYITRVRTMLNTLPDSGFTPDLSVLDQILSSLSIDPSAATWASARPTADVKQLCADKGLWSNPLLSLAQTDQAFLALCYPLFRATPYSTADFDLKYTDALSLVVRIKSRDVEAARARALAWIRSQGVDPSTHRIEWVIANQKDLAAIRQRLIAALPYRGNGFVVEYLPGSDWIEVSAISVPCRASLDRARQWLAQRGVEPADYGPLKIEFTWPRAFGDCSQ